VPQLEMTVTDEAETGCFHLNKTKKKNRLVYCNSSITVMTERSAKVRLFYKVRRNRDYISI